MTASEATQALYDGSKVTLRNPYNGRIISIERNKRGHVLPAVWVFEQDGKLSKTVNSGHNGMMLSREDILQWITDCEIVAVSA